MIPRLGFEEIDPMAKVDPLGKLFIISFLDIVRKNQSTLHHK